MKLGKISPYEWLGHALTIVAGRAVIGSTNRSKTGFSGETTRRTGAITTRGIRTVTRSAITFPNSTTMHTQIRRAMSVGITGTAENTIAKSVVANVDVMKYRH